MGPVESAYHREHFFVGGEYVDDESRPGNRVMRGQMYVEKLIPVGGVKHPLPLVFIHGGGQTATVRFKIDSSFLTNSKTERISIKAFPVSCAMIELRSPSK